NMEKIIDLATLAARTAELPGVQAATTPPTRKVVGTRYLRDGERTQAHWILDCRHLVEAPPARAMAWGAEVPCEGCARGTYRADQLERRDMEIILARMGLLEDATI